MKGIDLAIAVCIVLWVILAGATALLSAAYAVVVTVAAVGS